MRRENKRAEEEKRKEFSQKIYMYDKKHNFSHIYNLKANIYI